MHCDMLKKHCITLVFFLAPVQFQNVIHFYTSVRNMDCCTRTFVMITLLIIKNDWVDNFC